jgi:hypothetical protein
MISRIYGKFSNSGDVGSATTAANDTSEESHGGPQEPTLFASGTGRVQELAEFSLLNAYDTLHALTPSGQHFSDISANATVFPTTYASIGSFTQFNPDTKQFAGETMFLALRPPWVTPQPVQQTRLGRAYTGGPYIQLNYAFIGGRTAVEEIGGRAYYEFFDRIGLYYEPSYDLADGKMLYSEYGLRLKSKCDCWIFDIGLNDSINPSEVQVFAQLTLGGLGSMGRNPFGRNMLINNGLGF